MVYVQYNLRLRRNQLLNRTPESTTIVLDDVDTSTDWVHQTVSFISNSVVSLFFVFAYELLIIYQEQIIYPVIPCRGYLSQTSPHILLLVKRDIKYHSKHVHKILAQATFATNVSKSIFAIYVIVTHPEAELSSSVL